MLDNLHNKCHKMPLQLLGSMHSFGWLCTQKFVFQSAIWKLGTDLQDSCKFKTNINVSKTYLVFQFRWKSSLKLYHCTITIISLHKNFNPWIRLVGILCFIQRTWMIHSVGSETKNRGLIFMHKKHSAMYYWVSYCFVSWYIDFIVRTHMCKP